MTLSIICRFLRIFFLNNREVKVGYDIIYVYSAFNEWVVHDQKVNINKDYAYSFIIQKTWAFNLILKRLKTTFC